MAALADSERSAAEQMRRAEANPFRSLGEAVKGEKSGLKP